MIVLALVIGVVAGLRAAIGTPGGAAARGRIAMAFGSDRPAPIERAVAIVAAAVVVLLP